MLPSNFHSHCTFCDGRSHPEDFVKFAISRNFRAYGFSSHSPLPFETFWNMSACDMEEYINEINRLKHKYSGRIEIYLGLEIDYLGETYNASIPYFRALPLDYRIGSVHFLDQEPHPRPLSEREGGKRGEMGCKIGEIEEIEEKGEKGEKGEIGEIGRSFDVAQDDRVERALPLEEKNMAGVDGPFEEFAYAVELFYQKDIRLITKDFFYNSMRMVEAGEIDIVGHLDKIYQNGHLYRGFDFQADWYQKPLEDYLDFIAEKGLIVEINTKNFVGKRQTFPHINTFKSLLRRRIPVIVNSDCHFPDLVNDGQAETLAILKESGFKTTREIVKGSWQDIAIE